MLELLVVIVILVILMMILLPEFLNQSIHAKDARAKSYLTLAWQDLTITATSDESDFTNASQLAGELRYDDPSLSSQVVSDCSAATMASFDDKKIAIVAPQTNGAALVMCVRSSSGDIIELIGPVSGADPTIVLIGSLTGQKPVNIVAPSITGDVRDGQRLTAQEGGWESDTPPIYSYQWQRCDQDATSCINIGGGTAETYLVDANDVGSTFKVMVTATNESGSATATSAPTGYANTNLVGLPDNTSLPTISGTAAQGQTLTADKGTWTGAAPISYACQWQDSAGGANPWNDIAGATSCSYTIPASEDGNELRVEVKASNSDGEQDSYSAATDAVIPPPVNTASPAVTGFAQDTQTLSSSDGSWQYSPSAYSYRWQSSADGGSTWQDISGATASSFQIPYATYDGDQLRCQVTATNAAGSTVASSNSTATVVPVPPTNTSAPTESGTAQVGQTLTGTNGSWQGTPTISYADQWQRSANGSSGWSDIGGATTLSYDVQPADVGQYLRLEVTASNSGGATVADTSATSQVTSNLPVGMIVEYAGATPAPSGWALADGSCGYSSTSYPDLWAAIGATYGGSASNFCLPDLRGRIPLGKAASGTGSTLGGTGGSMLMGGGSISLPQLSFSFTTPAVGYSVGAIAAATPSWPGLGQHGLLSGSQPNWMTSFGSSSAGGGTSNGWTSFTRAGEAASASAVTPQASLSTATVAYRTVRYVIKTSTAALDPCGGIWLSASQTAPAGTEPADGSAAAGALAGCLDGAFSGHTPDMRGRFALGQSGAGIGSTINGAGGSLDFSQTVTRSVPSAQVTVPGVSEMITVPGGSYPTYISTCGGCYGNGAQQAALAGSGSGWQTAYTPAVDVWSSVGADSASTGAYGDSASTAASNPAYLTLRADMYTASSYNGATPGTIAAYGGSSTPSGWLAADGSCYPTAGADAALFAAIGYSYGGSGSTFCIPDLRGRFVLTKAASGTGSTVGASGGTLDITPSVSLPNFTPSFVWSPASFAFSIPDRQAQYSVAEYWSYGGYCCSGAANYPGGGTFYSQPFGGQTIYATPTGGWPQTIYGASTGAATATFPSENPAYAVVRYLIKQ